MKKNKDYEEDEKFENESFLVSFYRNNIILVWLFIIVMAIIIVFKFAPIGNNNTTSKEVILTIEPNANVTIGKGNTTTLIANINVDDANIIWSSNNEYIAKVNNGNVTGINIGKATIIATYIDSNNNKYTATKEIEVLEGDPSITLESVNFPEGDLYMPLNKEYQLNLILTPTNAVVTDKIFVSSEESVATVTNDGIVKAIGEGSARIIVTVNGKYKTAIDVFVGGNFSKPEIVISPTTISFNNSSRKIKVGNSELLNYTISPSNADKTKLSWKSSNNSVVYVDQNGKVTAKAAGTAVVTVSSINGKKDDITIEVYNDIVPVESIALSVDSINMEAGKNEVITPVVLPSNASNKGLNYSSSDTNVVTVTPNVTGEVAIISAIKKGSATVTISSGNIEKKLVVNVTGDGNNSEMDEDDPKVPTTIVVKSDRNNLAKTYEEARKIPVAGKTNVSIKFRNGVGKIKYCINKYGNTLCKPNVELYSDDVVQIPDGGIYVLRIIKYDYADNEIASSSINYIDGVLNYYINTGSAGLQHTVSGAYDNEASAKAYPVAKNSKVEISVNGNERYIKSCATSGTTACSPNVKVTTKYSYTLNKLGTWHIIVNEYDKNNNIIGDSKVYYVVVSDETDPTVIEYGQVKASNLKIVEGGKEGKYLSVDVESELSFYNVRFCYTMVNKNVLGTCNLDIASNNVPHYNNGSIVRPKEENKTYYATLSSTKKYTFKFYLDGLDQLFKNNDTNHDVIFEFAIKSSSGFSSPIKVRINMTSSNGTDSYWKSVFIK